MRPLCIAVLVCVLITPGLASAKLSPEARDQRQVKRFVTWGKARLAKFQIPVLKTSTTKVLHEASGNVRRHASFVVPGGMVEDAQRLLSGAKRPLKAPDPLITEALGLSRSKIPFYVCSGRRCP